jgi:hypothetical protein
MFTKNCPDCGCIQAYTSKKSLNSYIKKNKKCRSCVQKGKKLGIKLTEDHKSKISKASKGENNGFYNKTHSVETKIKLSNQKKGIKLSQAHKDAISKGNIRPMAGRSLHSLWLEKHGKEIADQKLSEFKSKISLSTSGKNNPMYGKPAPSGSGNGWKGWYKGIYFRSLLELSFLINYIERFNMKFESGEKAKWAIEYVKMDGVTGTYFPDYIINDKYMIEIKPKNLINTPSIKAKTSAAIEFCKNHGLKYKIFEPVKLNETIILELHKNNIIKFTKIYEDRFRKKFNMA